MDQLAVASEARALGGSPASSERDRQVHGRIGLAIRHRRRAMGLSLRDLARSCGISLQQIQKYEVGISSISAAQLWKLAHALAVPIEHFFEPLEPARLT